MAEYKNIYKVETQEVDTSLAALPEYDAMLAVLKAEDLPRHEQRFKEMLKEQTTNGLAMFHAQLQKDRQDIEDRIATINQSLRQIDYNNGTYITLLSVPPTTARSATFNNNFEP